MPGLPSWAQSGLPLIAALSVIVFFRAQATYWLGRAAAQGFLAGEGRSGFLGAIGRWFNGPVPRKGANLLERWGLVIIPLCFLTVGLQTAVLAAAGLVRMKWRTFTLAMIPGCLMWGTMYGLGLLAVWVSFWKAMAGSPWGWAGLAAIIGGGAVLKWHSRRRRAAKGTCVISPDAELPSTDAGTVASAATVPAQP